MILHHYATSPFAEKIRAIFGFKGIAWTSVQQPVIMPKADLQALTGGYRRIPVLQIGNDIYCDTTLICDVIEQLHPSPSLFPNHCEGNARMLTQWADSTLFTTAMAHNFSPEGAAYFFRDSPPDQAKAFGMDRAAMRGGAARMMPGEAGPAYKTHLARLAAMLAQQPFFFGAQPSLFDFAVYNPLWFTRSFSPFIPLLAEHANLLPWMDRMKAFSDKAASLSTPMTSDQAIATAKKEAQNAPFRALGAHIIDTHGLGLGANVAITAESFGLEATTGRLVGADNSTLSIERDDPRAGRVRVHFPRQGFVMKAAL